MKVWLVGCGAMAIDYFNVLQDIDDISLNVIGRGEKSANSFYSKTSFKPFVGGVFKATQDIELPEYAIVAVGVDAIHDATKELILAGVKNILVEKPAGISVNEVSELMSLAKFHSVNVYVGYNRRFYAAVLKAKEIIETDGGVESFQFELTEWAHIIAKLDKPKTVLENWFVANSTHVADLAYFLGGRPKEISCFTNGSLDWHERSSSFYGAGRTENGSLFSYSGNWESPGRWGLEVNTKEHRLLFRPMEELQVQCKGSVAISSVDIDDNLDKKYKPGLYLQVLTFFGKSMYTENLCTLKEHLASMEIYTKMAGYK